MIPTISTPRYRSLAASLMILSLVRILLPPAFPALAQPVPNLESAPICVTEASLWAEVMTAQLPLFANLVLTRLGSAYHVVLVSSPDITPLSTTEIQSLGLSIQPDQPQPNVVRIYFTTLERQLVVDSDPNVPTTGDFRGRETQTVRLAYELYLARPTSPARQPWQVARVNVIGEGIPIRDVSEGTVAQAIRAWQTAGCPVPSDLELEP